VILFKKWRGMDDMLLVDIVVLDRKSLELHCYGGVGERSSCPHLNISNTKF
jgi:hypothetical protein